MKISEIMSMIESFAPLCLALDWDNVGLLIGDQEREVSKVLISLDFTPNSLEHAIDTGAELILSHHPVLFRGTKRITDPLLLKCIEHNIALVALHTNLDTAIYSVNHALANALDFVVIEHLSPESGLSKCSNIDHLDGLYGLGLICHAKKQMNLGELALHCKERLGIPALRWWTAGKSEGSSALRIARCGGAGSSVLGEAAQKADMSCQEQIMNTSVTAATYT